MNITLNIVASDPTELREAIAGLAGIVTGAPVPTQEKKRTSKEIPKPEKQPDPDPEKQSEIESTTESQILEETPEDPTETKEIPTVVELRAAAQLKGQTPEGKKAIKALLDKFESKSISDVPDDKRAAFLTGLEEL